MWRFHFDPSPRWRAAAIRDADQLAADNIRCAASGDRSYRLAVNVKARTVEARKMTQGSGVHGAKGYQ
jgi:hypothetical protein